MAPEGEERRKTDRRRTDRRKGDRREGDRRRTWQRDQAKNTLDAWEALEAERSKEAEQEPKGGLFRRKRQS